MKFVTLIVFFVLSNPLMAKCFDEGDKISLTGLLISANWSHPSQDLIVSRSLLSLSPENTICINVQTMEGTKEVVSVNLIQLNGIESFKVMNEKVSVQGSVFADGLSSHYIKEFYLDSPVLVNE
ncbi:MAG: hypothetical protein AB8E15_10955 [Bdellovibrionales bacterium]